MATRTTTTGILSEGKTSEREEIIELLKKAYWMEIETVMSYTPARSTPTASAPRRSSSHWRRTSRRSSGTRSASRRGSRSSTASSPARSTSPAEQCYLQPPAHQTDIVHVVKGVIEAETGAIEHYNRIIEFTDGLDFVTQDMVIGILRDEEGHRRLFEGYLREYAAEGLA